MSCANVYGTLLLNCPGSLKTGPGSWPIKAQPVGSIVKYTHTLRPPFPVSGSLQGSSDPCLVL